MAKTSEEKPTFKVTDRRLFNPDGTPREGVERPEEAAPPPPSPTPEPAQPLPPPADAGGQPQSQQAEPPRAAADEAGEAGGREAAAGAPETSQELLMLVEFVASFAADAMGMVAHPGAPAPADVNLPLARQCIDMLGALRQKTGGRLSDEEQRFLDSILSQLRMQYVSLTTATRGAQPQPPRGGGFSGSDITGGR
jgi:hypothetical protein